MEQRCQRSDSNKARRFSFGNTMVFVCGHIWQLLCLLMALIIFAQMWYIVELRQHRLNLGSLNRMFLETQSERFVEYENSFVLPSVAYKYSSEGKFKEALAWADLCVNLYGDSGESWRRVVLEDRGDIYFKMGDYLNAVQDYSSAIDTDVKKTIDLDTGKPKPPYLGSIRTLYFKRGMAYRNSGNDQKAVEDFRLGIMWTTHSRRELCDILQHCEISLLPEELYQYLEQHEE